MYEHRALAPALEHGTATPPRFQQSRPHTYLPAQSDFNPANKMHKKK
jgi:hypothetical protein